MTRGRSKALERLRAELPKDHPLLVLLHEIDTYQEQLRMQQRELREMQHALELSRDRYANLYDFAPFAYLEHDGNGIISMLNLTATRLLKVDRQNVEGRPLLLFVSQADRPIFLEHLRRLRAGEDPVLTEMCLRGRNGDQLPSQVFSRTSGGTGARPLYRTAITDMSEIKQAEVRRRMTEQRLAAALEASRGGVFEYTIPSGDGYFCSRDWAEMLRFDRDELPPPEEFERWLVGRIHPDDRKRAEKAFASVHDGRSPGYRIDVRIRRKDGAYIWERILAKVIDWNDEQKTTRVVGVTLDITDEKRHSEEIERRVSQLRHLASELLHVEERERRQLASDLHDDLGQLLAAAKLKLYLLKQAATGQHLEERFAELSGILDDADQSMRAVIFRASPPVLHDLGLGPALEWLAREVERQYGLNVQVQVEDDLPALSSEVRTMVFRSVREVLINVVRHAKTDGARIELGTGARRGWLRALIMDSGVGFDPKRLRWGSGKGGFGLLSVRERIEAIGGTLAIESAPGRGTRVEIAIPIGTPVRERPAAADRAASTPTPATALPRHDPPGSTAPRIRVLLADDHGVARSAIASMLSAEPDLEVVAEAADGEAALELARQYPVDVVVMDVSMPRLNGIEATRRLLKEFPYVQVIGLSMHEGEDMAAVMRQAGAAAYVTKSGPVEALVSTIRSVYASVAKA